MDPDKIAHELSKRGKAWAELDQAASLLEETKKTVLAQCTLGANGSSQSSRESTALASELYKSHVESMVEARGKANIARIAFDVYRTYVELLRTKAATDRAEMGMR